MCINLLGLLSQSITVESYCLVVLKTEILSSGYWPCQFFLRSARKNLFMLSLSFSCFAGNLSHSLAYRSLIWYLIFTQWSLWCMFVSRFPLVIRTTVILDWGPPYWPNLNESCLQWPCFQITSHSEVLEM